MWECEREDEEDRGKEGEEEGERVGVCSRAQQTLGPGPN